MRTNPRKDVFRLAAVLLIAWTCAPTRGAAPAAPFPPTIATAPANIELTPAEQAAILRQLRAAVTPELVMKSAENLPLRLHQPGGQTILVGVYFNGERFAQAAAAENSIADAVASAARQLKAACIANPRGAGMARGGRLQVDIVAAARALDIRLLPENKILMDPGVEGLLIKTAEGVELIAPLTALRRSHDAGLAGAEQAGLRRLAITEELLRILRRGDAKPDLELPRADELAAFSTQAFIESKPGGEPLPLRRGGVPIADADKGFRLRSLLLNGNWMLKVRRDDADAENYDPLLRQALPSSDPPIRLECADCLLTLSQITEDPAFLTTADSIIAATQREVHQEDLPAAREEGDTAAKFEIKLAYVRYRHPRPEPQATAIYLQLLAHRADLPDAATDLDLMERLGRYLLFMIAPKGHLYANMRDANAAKETIRSAEGTEEEAAIALCMLTRHSTDPVWLKGARKLLDTAVWEQRDQPSARLVAALAESYLVTADRKYGDLCVSYARRLISRQLGKTNADGQPTPSDFIGGFGPQDPPDVRHSAQAVAALVYANIVAETLGEPSDVFRQAAARGIEFILNHQFSPGNSFYLPDAASLEGAFRQGPTMFFVRMADSTAAFRALFAAYSAL